jgi:hypothetical protein
MAVLALVMADLALRVALVSHLGLADLQRAVIVPLARRRAWSQRGGVSARTGWAAGAGAASRRGRAVHFRLTRRRCQRRTVPGVTSVCARSYLGRI